MEFSPFSHRPKSTVPCLQNGVKNSGLQSIPQQVTSDSVFLLPAIPLPPATPALTLLTPRYIHSVCPCVCVCGGGGGGGGGGAGGGGRREGGGVRIVEYYVSILFLKFSFIHFFDLVKRGMLTLVGEIRRYRNDRYYYLLLKKKKKKLCLQNNQIKGAKQYNQYSPKHYNMFIECKHQHPALTAIWNCSQNDFTYVHDQNMWLI